ARELPQNLPTQLNVFLHEHRLLPNSYASGFQFVQSRAAYRDGYLLGQYSGTGWWYYYPVVMAAKTPLAMMLLTLMAIIILARRGGRAIGRHWWAVTCVLLPAGMYLGIAMSQNL